jgi:hypothetical protein
MKYTVTYEDLLFCETITEENCTIEKVQFIIEMCASEKGLWELTSVVPAKQIPSDDD